VRTTSADGKNNGSAIIALFTLRGAKLQHFVDKGFAAVA
jgi:hypothetical protein